MTLEAPDLSAGPLCAMTASHSNPECNRSGRHQYAAVGSEHAKFNRIANAEVGSMDRRLPTHARRSLAGLAKLAQRFRRGWPNLDASERYLAAATDHADLERRMRALERMNSGPVLPTFNH